MVNFCEIDYAVTPYIAEFVNTLTNLAYMILAFTTLPSKSSTVNLFSWPLANTALLLIGLGSFAFHATLKHYAQLADESAMYVIVTVLNYQVYTHKLLNTPASKAALGLALALTATIVIFHNITFDGADNKLHLALFTTLVNTFWPRALYLCYTSTAPSITAAAPATKQFMGASVHVPPQLGLQEARLSKYRAGTSCFVLGFILWVLDGFACEQLRALRAVLGLPLAWLFELHGWWHVLTAVGAGSFVDLVADLTSDTHHVKAA